jgi:hypothetical protein
MEFAWTLPRDIDGPPEDVRDLTIQQLRTLGELVGELTADSIVQIRSADLGPMLSKPGPGSKTHIIQEWEDGEIGRLTETLAHSASDFIRTIESLVKAA